MEIQDKDLEIEDEKLMPKIAEMAGGAKKKVVKKTSKKAKSKKTSKKIGGAVKKTSKKIKSIKKESKKVSKKTKASKKVSKKISRKKSKKSLKEEKTGGVKLNKKTSKKVKRTLAPGMLAFKEFSEFVAKELNEKNGVQLKKKAGEFWRKAKETVKDPKNVEALLKEAKKIFLESKK